METSYFLQADDIYKVIQVPFAVNAGKTTDDEIEKFIGLDSNGRQGRYYRLAAEAFNLIRNINNYSTLTHVGKEFVALGDAQRLDFIAHILRNTPVFSEGIQYLNKTPKADINALRKWFVSNYPGSENTADRRFSTFVKYLQATRYL